MANLEPSLDAIVEVVLESAKYRTIAPEFVRKIAAEELRKTPKPKEAIKATKNRLHQAAGAYLSALPNYDAWLERLSAASTSDERRAVCRALMHIHASTHERMAILDTFYQKTLADIAPVRSVLDLACGLNPLAISYMPLAEDATYYACDLYTDQAAFFNAAFPLLGVSGEAWAADITQTVPQQHVDLVLIIKTIPCLQQIDKGIGLRLLEGVHADHILVSYPTQSIGGREKGMRATYQTQFGELVAGKSWKIRRYDFPTELAFLITKT